MSYRGRQASHMHFIALGGLENRPMAQLQNLCRETSTYAGHDDFVRCIKEMTWEEFARLGEAHMIDYSKGQAIATYRAAGREVVFRPENPKMLKELTEYLERPF